MRRLKILGSELETLHLKCCRYRHLTLLASIEVYAWDMTYKIPVMKIAMIPIFLGIESCSFQMTGTGIKSK